MATVVVDGTLVASVYVPNGGKDYAAKMRFLEELAAWSAALVRAGQPLVLCGDLNVAHTDRDLHPKERKPGTIGQRPDERAVFDRLLGGGLVDVGRSLNPDSEDHVLVVGAVAQHAAAEHRLAHRLRPGQPGAGLRAPRAASILTEIGTSDHAPVIVDFA